MSKSIVSINIEKNDFDGSMNIQVPHTGTILLLGSGIDNVSSLSDYVSSKLVFKSPVLTLNADKIDNVTINSPQDGTEELFFNNNPSAIIMHGKDIVNFASDNCCSLNQNYPGIEHWHFQSMPCAVHISAIAKDVGSINGTVNFTDGIKLTGDVINESVVEEN